MTRQQYYDVAENFSCYADKEVEYKSRAFSYDRKYKTYKAILVGVGIGANAEHFILAGCGEKMAIHYSKIKMPK